MFKKASWSLVLMIGVLLLEASASTTANAMGTYVIPAVSSTSGLLHPEEEALQDGNGNYTGVYHSGLSSMQVAYIQRPDAGWTISHLKATMQAPPKLPGGEIIWNDWIGVVDAETGQYLAQPLLRWGGSSFAPSWDCTGRDTTQYQGVAYAIDQLPSGNVNDCNGSHPNFGIAPGDVVDMSLDLIANYFDPTVDAWQIIISDRNNGQEDMLVWTAPGHSTWVAITGDQEYYGALWTCDSKPDAAFYNWEMGEAVLGEPFDGTQVDVAFNPRNDLGTLTDNSLFDGPCTATMDYIPAGADQSPLRINVVSVTNSGATP